MYSEIGKEKKDKFLDSKILFIEREGLDRMESGGICEDICIEFMGEVYG